MGIQETLSDTSISFEAMGFLFAALSSDTKDLNALGLERGILRKGVSAIMAELRAAGFCRLDPSLKRDEDDMPWIWTEKCQPLQAELLENA